MSNEAIVNKFSQQFIIERLLEARNKVPEMTLACLLDNSVRFVDNCTDELYQYSDIALIEAVEKYVEYYTKTMLDIQKGTQGK